MKMKYSITLIEYISNLRLIYGIVSIIRVTDGFVLSESSNAVGLHEEAYSFNMLVW